MTAPLYRLMVNGRDCGTCDDEHAAVNALLGKHSTRLENGSIVVPSALLVPYMPSVLEEIKQGADLHDQHSGEGTVVRSAHD